MLPIGNEKLGILDIKKVSNLDREIAIPIDFFYAHLYSCHNKSSGFPLILLIFIFFETLFFPTRL